MPGPERWTIRMLESGTMIADGPDTDDEVVIPYEAARNLAEAVERVVRLTDVSTGSIDDVLHEAAEAHVIAHEALQAFQEAVGTDQSGETE